MVRVLVCGGRDFQDTHYLYKTLDTYHKVNQIDVIIEGGARGADRIAGYWARKNKVDLLIYPAQWNLHGKGAGPIRNQQMLDEGKPNVVIAFAGGKGTADMVKRAKAAGVEVIEV